MADFFKLSRFNLLLKNHLIETRRKYILFTICLFSLALFIVLLFFLFNSPYANDFNSICNCKDGTILKKTSNFSWRQFQMVIYLGGVYLFGGLFALTSFTNFGNQGEAIFYMNKPASIFEKWFLEVFVRIFLYLLVFHIIYFLIFTPSTWIYNILEYQQYLEYYDKSKISTYEIKDRFCSDGSTPIFNASPLMNIYNFLPSKFKLEYILLNISSFTTGIAFLMYGTVLFNKYSLFKTFLLGFGIFLIYLLYFYLLDHNSNNPFIVEGWENRIMNNSAENIKNNNLYVEINSNDKLPIYWIFMIVTPIGLLFVSYFKLKEKQI